MTMILILFGLGFFFSDVSAQLDATSILFTNPKIDETRAKQLFQLLLQRPEYASLPIDTLEARFLTDLRVPASEADLKKQLQKIQDESILVEIGPDYIYGPAFFPKVPNRIRLVGFDLNANVQNDIIRFAFNHLTSRMDYVNLGYLLDDTGFDYHPFKEFFPLDFLESMVGRFIVHYARDFPTVEVAMSKLLQDGANVIVLNTDQSRVLEILEKADEKNTLQPPFHWLTFNAGLTLSRKVFNVTNTNFYSVEFSMNGEDYKELTNMPPPLTINDLLFRDMAVVGLQKLAEHLSVSIPNVSLITSTLDPTHLQTNTISQTWKFYTYMQYGYNSKSLYSLQRTPDGKVVGNLEPLKPPMDKEALLAILRSKPLRLGTVVKYPLVQNVTSAAGNGVTAGGPVITLAQTLLDKLNVSYSITVFDSNSNDSNLQEGSTIFERLEEWDIDMLVGPFTVSPSRRNSFQCTSPYQSISYKFMYKEPSLKASMQIFQFSVAFSGYTWLVIFISTLVFACALALLHKISPNTLSYDIHPAMLFIFGYLVQGVRTRPPNRTSSQVLIVVWWFFCLVIAIAFCANYAAYRSFTAMQTLPTSLSSLMHQSYYKYAYIKQSNVEHVIQTSLEPSIYAVYQMINSDFKSSIPLNREDGIKQVLEGDFALIDESPFIDYYASKLCLQTGFPFLHETYSFCMPKAFPYFHLIEDELKLVIADGTANRIFKEAQEAEKVKMGGYCGATIGDQALAAMRNPLINWSNHSIEFDAAFGIFVVCLIGLVIVAVIVAIECCNGVYKKTE